MGISIVGRVGFGVVCQVGYTLIAAADGAAHSHRARKLSSASHPPRLTVMPTDVRDEPPEAADHPEMAADAISAVSGRFVEIAWALVLQEVTMNLALWIIAGALAVVFASSGLMKLGVPKDELVASSDMGWAESFSQAQIRWIGAAELCGGVGLIAPLRCVSRRCWLRSQPLASFS